MLTHGLCGNREDAKDAKKKSHFLCANLAFFAPSRFKYVASAD
jgi:hypothetical protein